MEDFLSNVFITQNNELDISYKTPYGIGDKSIPSEFIVPNRCNLNSICIFDRSNIKFPSSIKVKYRDDFNSKYVIPFYNDMDVSYKLVQPPTTTVNFSVIKDTYVREARPTLNYGSSQSLVVGDMLEGKYYTLLQVDFSSIKNYSNIYFVAINLFLKLYANQNFNVDIYEIGGDWSESGTTWLSAQSLPTKYIKSVQVVNGINNIDLKEYIKSLIDNGEYILNLLLKTNDDGYFSIMSRESSDSTSIPKLSLSFRDLNWVGNLGENNFSSKAYLKAHRYNNLYSYATLKNGNYNFKSLCYIDDPSSRLSKVIINRCFLNCTAKFKLRNDFNSLVKIPALGITNDTLSQSTINKSLIYSKVNIVIKNDFNSTVIIQRVNQQYNFTSKTEIKNAFILSKAKIYSSSILNSSAILNAKGLPFNLISKAIIKNAFILSKVKFRFKNDFNSTAFLHNFVNCNFNSVVTIKQEYNYKDFNSKALILNNVDFNSTVIIQRVNQQYNFTSKTEIKNAFILSKVKFRLFNNCKSYADLRQSNNFISNVSIMQVNNLSSNCIVRQFDLNEIMAKVYINSNNYKEYLSSLVKIQIESKLTLNCKVTVYTDARFWTPNTYGGLKYNRVLPRLWKLNL